MITGCNNIIMPEMVFVQGGAFTMGCTSEQESDCNKDEIPAHQVTVSDFQIGKYPVTQAQWVSVMGSNPSSDKGDDLPVTDISWNTAQEFISKLNSLTGKNYRLPTEAEWEYAARGGNKSKGFEYSGSNDIDDVAWYWGNSDGNINPVGTKQPNELGIYDMSGNVWEMCYDWFDSYSSSAKNDPKGPDTGSSRVLRGGSYEIHASRCRVSNREYGGANIRDPLVGFRLACD